jgi:hypothetical protein
VAVPDYWPNGSLVLMAPDTDFPGLRLGHVVRDGERYRAWAATEESYRDKGLHEGFLAAMSALSKHVTKQVVVPAAPLKATSKVKPASKANSRKPASRSASG